MILDGRSSPGVWYSPVAVFDLDGDGAAEVAVKNSDGDYRDAEGHVYSGPEYLSILDGRTGKLIASTDWISREPWLEAMWTGMGFRVFVAESDHGCMSRWLKPLQS